MARFIPVDKIRKLRDASKQGDLRAKKILDMQMNGTDDFGPDLDAYFTNPEPAPVAQEQTVAEAAQATETPYQMYLRENELEDNDDVRKEFTEATGNVAEMPHVDGECKCECVELMKELMGEERDAIDSYSKAITQVMASEQLDDNQKRKIITRLEEIKSDEIEHHAELKQLISVCDEKI